MKFVLKNAAVDLSKDLRHVAKGAAVFVAVGTFFGGDWNIVAAVVVFATIEAAAFILRAYADGLPDP